MRCIEAHQLSGIQVIQKLLPALHLTKPLLASLSHGHGTCSGLAEDVPDRRRGSAWPLWRHTCGVTVNSPGEEDVHVKPYDADSHPWEVFPLKWSHAQAGCAQRIRIGFQGS